ELTMLQDRFPLSRQDLDRVWGALLPLGTGSLLEVALPGSTQDRLNLELGLGKTPPAGTVTGEATLRTAPTPGPPAAVIPFPSVTRAIPPSEPTRRVTPVEDLDATWIARPMRLDSDPPGRPRWRSRRLLPPWRRNRPSAGTRFRRSPFPHQPPRSRCSRGP